MAGRGAGRETARGRRAATLPGALRDGEAGELAEEPVLEGMAVSGDPPATGGMLYDVELTGVLWSGGRFGSTSFRRPRCCDVVFVGCDFSGAVFDDAGLRRVEFRRCRMSGVVLAGSACRDVLFDDCKLDLANLRMMHANTTEFVDCDLREADFYGSTLARSGCYDCDITGADFSQAHTDRLRLHGSTIRDLKGAAGLDGAVIAPDQRMEMAMTLLAASGITVEEPQDRN